MDPYNRYNSYSGSYHSSPSHHSHSGISPAGSFYHETPAPPNSAYPPPGYATVHSLPHQPSYGHYPYPQAPVSNPYPATPPSCYPPPPYACPPEPHPYPGQGGFLYYGSFHYQQTSFSNSHIESPAAPATFPSYPDHAYPPSDTHYPNSVPTAPLADAQYPNSYETVPSGSDSPPAKPYYPVNDVLSVADMQISDKPSRPSYPVPPETPVHHSPYALPTQYSQNSFSYPSSPAGSLSSDASFPYSSGSFNSVQGQSLAIVPSQNTPNSMQMAPYQASKDVLLHGILDIWIHEAKNLPNMDLFSENLRKIFGRAASGRLSNKLENASQHVITSDPYVNVCLSDAVVARTRVISNDINPVWNQHFSVPVAHNVEQVVFVVKDSDVVGAQLIGKVTILAEKIRSCQRIEDSYPIVGSACKKGATLKISIQLFPVANQLLSRFGFGLGPDYIGVANAYFPLRTAGRVTLYQDAHVPDHVLPPITLDNQFVFTQGKCWYDICQAIMQARHLIYIIGWSVFHKVRLVRDTNIPTPERLDTLGDLLKYKSQEGLRVLVLVWDDPTSRDILGFKKDGIMATHDEETRRFFKHSSVQVILCPRFAGKKRSWLKQQEVNIIFTHHQKTVILDSEAPAKQRQIIAFLGGLDLCDGRYDTPQHNLFRTLGTVHKDDYHNPNLQGDIQCGGPREPWHDLHCKIEGPAAYDVLKNFEQRWIKAAKRYGLKKLSHKPNEDSLIALERLPYIMNQSDIAYCYENDNEKWHVQIFRSIDSGSVKGFPKDVNEVEAKNLVYIKNLVVDSSIHTAYVEAIRTAANFVYIENQYFLGSSYNWSQHREIGANNMIPMELALKVAEKIRANERFAVYIVIPMWPEGVPTSMSVQRILYWQGQTIQMMYETIYKALEETGLNRKYQPQDYLNFFCLGNREVKDPNEMQSPIEPTENSHAQAKKARRFMIYVHSKGMIVDDEYVIIGSANINQRSMDGSRDTEIAMGAYQPQYTRANRKHPHGQVYGYRMSLWAEHLGQLEQCFEHPESLECVRSVRMHAEHNWKQYVDNEVTEMKGHLMQYPILVEANGEVKPLPGHKTFPDMGGNILGSLGTVPSYVKENLTI